MSCMAGDELLALALARITFLRPRERLRLAALPGGVSTLLRLPLEEVERRIGRSRRKREWNPAEAVRLAERDLRHLTAGGIRCTFYWSLDFPPQLRMIHDPPLVLYYRGALPGGEAPLVAVVGTRKPTGAGRSAAFSLAFDIAGLGLATVSGLARGIDVEAHRGSLAAGGTTVAVLGNGIDTIFPQSSRAVGRRLLAAGGALLSEYPPGVPPAAYQFPARNRIISGLARATVVVQAPERSGALITADYALEQGRDLLVHQAGLCGPASGGTSRLAAEGAPVARCGADVLREWGWLAAEEPAREAPAEAPGGVEQGRRLAQAMDRELRREVAHNNGELYTRRR